MSENLENRQIAVKVSGVKKKYKLGQIGGGSLQADLQSWWARVRGKEDPNSKIGENQRSNGKTFMALNGVDITIYKGEAVGIIGGNGAGKSTLLKLLSRVTAPTEGSIDIYGRIASMLEVGTGFNPEMTGRENVYLNGAILGMTKAEIDAKMEQIIEFSEVREFIDTPVKRYSSGMFVKLAFSVAAHLDAEIMIMDEVLAVGDMAFQTKCLDKMRDAANAEGRTVLYVSHNMNTIRRLCDRCIVLDKGKVVFQGDVEDSIAYYMGETNNLSLMYEYDGEHKDFNTDMSIHIDSTKILDKDYPIYDFGEKMRIEINYTSKKKIDDMTFRFTLFSNDGVAVGLASSLPVVSTVTGKNSVIVTMNLDALAPGKYSFRIIAYSVNKYGNNQDHDVVDKAFYFEKMLGDENNKMEWNHNWWGYIKFPDVDVKKCND
jgi:ABC-type polysaccharide/polyol phosphate transport system ATPase subunit